MASTAKYVPDYMIDGGGSAVWFCAPACSPDITVGWQRIDEGVGTPNDADYVYSLAKTGIIEIKFDMTSLETDIDFITEVVFGMRFAGAIGADYPYMILKCYTDYPTTKARQIGSDKQINTLTSGTITNTSFSFVDTVSPEEYEELRLVVEAWGSAVPVGDTPEAWRD